MPVTKMTTVAFRLVDEQMYRFSVALCCRPPQALRCAAGLRRAGHLVLGVGNILSHSDHECPEDELLLLPCGRASVSRCVFWCARYLWRSQVRHQRNGDVSATFLPDLRPKEAFKLGSTERRREEASSALLHTALARPV